MPEFSRDEALKFIGCACRNWSNLCFSNDDLQDFATELSRFVAAKDAEIARLREEKELFQDVVERAQHIIGERYLNWHAAAMRALSK